MIASGTTLLGGNAQKVQSYRTKTAWRTTQGQACEKVSVKAKGELSFGGDEKCFQIDRDDGYNFIWLYLIYQ